MITNKEFETSIWRDIYKQLDEVANNQFGEMPDMDEMLGIVIKLINEMTVEDRGMVINGIVNYWRGQNWKGDTK